MNTVRVEYRVDGGAFLTQDFTGLGLAANGFTNLTLTPVTGISLGVHTFEAKTSLPNGVADPFTTYDLSSAPFTRSSGTLPIIENFESASFPPVYWSRENPGDDCVLWIAENREGLIGPAGTLTTAAFLNANAYTGTGQLDMLVVPQPIPPKTDEGNCA